MAPNEDQMDDEEGGGKEVEVAQEGAAGKDGPGYHACDADGDEDGLVEARAPFAHADGHGNAGGGIGLHVADIVDIEYAHAETAHGASRQEGMPKKEGAAAEVVAAHGYRQPEEEEHINIAESAVAIGMGAQGVAHGGNDSQKAKNYECERRKAEEGAEGEIDHQESEETRQGNADADEHLDVVGGEIAALDGIAHALAVVAVGTVDGVAQFVGEVAYKLEENGGEDEEGDNGPMDYGGGVCGRNAHGNTG